MNCNIYTVFDFSKEKRARSDGGSFPGSPFNFVFPSLKSTIRFTLNGAENLSKFLGLKLGQNNIKKITNT
jgi:hypothetical protein